MPIKRASMSVPPPGGKVTMMSSGLFGKSPVAAKELVAAQALTPTAAAMWATLARKLRRCICIPLVATARRMRAAGS
ncbi:Uncharacterised protein [Bordetella pertussis]|nr:Uncharacterised protein [Bordetella pertussis]